MWQGTSGEHGVWKRGQHMIECMQVCVIFVVMYLCILNSHYRTVLFCILHIHDLMCILPPQAKLGWHITAYQKWSRTLPLISESHCDFRPCLSTSYFVSHPWHCVIKTLHLCYHSHTCTLTLVITLSYLPFIHTSLLSHPTHYRKGYMPTHTPQ